MQSNQEIIYINKKYLTLHIPTLALTPEMLTKIQSANVKSLKDQSHIRPITQYIHQCRIQTINFRTNLSQMQTGIPFLQQIYDVNMSALKELILNQCSIESLQFLCRIRLPSLSILSLGLNHINQIHGLRKCNFPQIHKIFLYGNYIVDFNTLCEGAFGKKIKLLFIRFFQDQFHQADDIRWIMKMEAQKIFHFRAQNGKDKIKIRNIEKNIRQKCGFFILYWDSENHMQ